MNIFMFFLTVVAGCYIFLLTLPIFGIDLSVVETYSKIFSNLGLGFGAIFGAVAGFKYVGQKDREALSKIKALKDQYPLDKFKIKFDLVQPSSAKGTIYIRDLDTKMIHHIGNRYMYRDLGLFGLPVISLTEDEFIKSKKGETYITRGEIGD